MIFWRKNSKDDTKETPANPVEQPAAVAVPEPVASPPAPAEPAVPSNWLAKLSRGLSKSSGKITQGIGDLLTKRKLDQEMLDQLEELLITADLGPRTAARLVAEFGKDRFGKDISGGEIAEALAASIAKILQPVAIPLDMQRAEDGPFTVLVCGVNGVGKTTTIGKIAYDLQRYKHRNVLIAAGDTFRAAAVEQLDIWATRAGCQFFAKDIGADSAAVAYESYEQAWQKGVDVLMIDTAGRLHNKANLMQELEKIVRVLKKKKADVPHATLLVLDATTGQNAVEQVRTFKEMVNVTGLIVTKLDGSAKGGIVVALADQFGLPIHYIGVGEGQEDLQPFDPVNFARSLVGLS
ncbi:MAG: signal recognition particle-docking protein FtsY [Alphaproteobacteria bacterium]|nr:signal recognition particle-docking protein FtsY [Alphaproteobacteria bacterium]MBU0859312.1 signal recognition particle-docking protein FtsY [Alphaproteobacteria bacterium]